MPHWVDDRLELMEATDADLEPILLAYGDGRRGQRRRGRRPLRSAVGGSRHRERRRTPHLADRRPRSARHDRRRDRQARGADRRRPPPLRRVPGAQPPRTAPPQHVGRPGDAGRLQPAPADPGPDPPRRTRSDPRHGRSPARRPAGTCSPVGPTSSRTTSPLTDGTAWLTAPPGQRSDRPCRLVAPRAPPARVGRTRRRDHLPPHLVRRTGTGWSFAGRRRARGSPSGPGAAVGRFRASYCRRRPPRSAPSLEWACCSGCSSVDLAAGRRCCRATASDRDCCGDVGAAGRFQYVGAAEQLSSEPAAVRITSTVGVDHLHRDARSPPRPRRPARRHSHLPRSARQRCASWRHSGRQLRSLRPGGRSDPVSS